MNSRTYTYYGINPIILVVPYGPECNYLIDIAKTIAKNIDCSCVINQGFEKSNVLSVESDLADCNSIYHITKPVIFDEFLKPLIHFKERLLALGHSPFVFNLLHSENLDIKIGVVLGSGRGKLKDSFSCKYWQSRLFTHLWRKNCLGEIYEGKGDGDFSGRNSSCLNQYYRKISLNYNVNSLQLTFPFSRLKFELQYFFTKEICVLLNEFMKTKSFSGQPETKFI